MNEMLDLQIEQADLVEPRQLTFEEILEVAGGPQVTNDWPG
ncbi:hypothetical protein [Roseateles chitosanitabidus]|nr:hypothetical protein [Roseateles chitosanitabidus]